MRHDLVVLTLLTQLLERKGIELLVLGYAIQTVARFRLLPESQQQHMNYKYGEKYPRALNDCLRELILSFTDTSQQSAWQSLHWAVSDNSIEVNDIMVLLQNDPGAVRSLLGPNRMNILPIHLLCASTRPRLEIADVLIAAFPFCVHQVTAEGMLPLHLCARYCASVPFLQLILQANERALSQKTIRHATCLHMAVLNPCHDVFLALLRVYPPAMHDIMRPDPSDDLRGTPLRIAIHCKNLPAVHALLKANPSLCRDLFEDTQEHPLHYAARFSSLPIVQAILDTDRDLLHTPSGVLQTNALHFATLNADDEVLHYLLSQSPPTSTIPSTAPAGRGAPPVPVDPLVDVRGQHAVHALVKSSHLSPERLHLLLQRFPAALSLRDREGNLPLHLFFDSSSEAEFNSGVSDPHSPSSRRYAAFLVMLQEYPEACAQRNNRNCLPLHRFAEKVDSALGFPSVGGASPGRKRRCSGGMMSAMLRALLRVTLAHADEAALGSVTAEGENIYQLLTRHENLDGGVRSIVSSSGHCSEDDSGVTIRREMERLLLRAHPTFDEPLLRRLNYSARRMALFLGFSAGTLNSKNVNIFSRLRKVSNGEIFAYVVTYL